MAPDEIEADLRAAGLRLRGGFCPGARELVDTLGQPVRTVLLVGNVGSEIWAPFSAARKTIPPDERDPMNWWIERTVGAIAERANARVVFTHHGPPFHPFLSWAARSEPVHPSPLGIFIHPRYGLWHAYRAAFLFDEVLALPPQAPEPSPCATCVAQPCRSACPFPEVALVDNHVAGCMAREPSPCLAEGCAARRACPVGCEFQYAPPHMRFHMEAFLASMQR